MNRLLSGIATTSGNAQNRDLCIHTLHHKFRKKIPIKEPSQGMCIHRTVMEKPA